MRKMTRRKSMCIVAKVNSDGKPIVLGSSSSAVAPLTKLNFFRFAKPALLMQKKKVIQIGDVPRVVFDLSTPVAANGEGELLPITHDSPLLDDEHLPGVDSNSTAWHHEVQIKGGQLMANLYRDLHVVACYRHRNFSRSLNALGCHYLPRVANLELLKKQASHFVAAEVWQPFYFETRSIRTAVRGYLTCADADEQSWIERFEHELRKHHDAAELDESRIEAMSAALANLRNTLMCGPTGPDEDLDPILADLGKRGNLPWLFNYPADPAYFVPGCTLDEEGTQVSRTGKRSFLEYYRQFRRHSDNLWRFVKSYPLHPLAFAWLASKYQAYAAVDQNVAADRMAEVSIFAQSERIPGESAAGRKRNVELVKTVFQTPSTIPAELNDDNYLGCRRVVEQRITTVLEPDDAFTANALCGVLQRLFSWLVLTGSDEVSTLLQGNDPFEKFVRRLYSRIQVTKPKSGVVTLADLQEALKAECRTTEDHEFVDGFLAKVDSQAKDPQTAVKEALVVALAEASLKQFDTDYVVMGKRIQQQGDQARTLYFGWLKDVVASQNDLPGCPNMVECEDQAGLVELMQERVASDYQKGDVSDLAAERNRAIRGIVFGEYLLATPEKYCTLGRQDLSQCLTVILEMIIHFASDPDSNPALYTNQASVEGTREYHRLARINLSGAYPIPDGSSELRQILSYTYLQVQRLQQNSSYLKDLAEIGRAIKALEHTDVDVLLLNDTIANHTRTTRTFGNLVSARHKPTVIYLTQQAFTDPANAAVELNTFIARIMSGLSYGPVQMPIVVTPVKVQHGVKIPVIDPTTINLPRLRLGQPGENDGGNDVVVTRLIQHDPFMLLGLSLLTTDADFGQIAPRTLEKVRTGDTTQTFWDVPDDVADKWERSLNTKLVNGDSVAKLLHRAWYEYASHRSANPLYSTLVSISMFNLAVTRARSTEILADLADNFSALLKEALRDSEAVNLMSAAFGEGVQRALTYSCGRGLMIKQADSWTEIPPTPLMTPPLHKISHLVSSKAEHSSGHFELNFAGILSGVPESSDGSDETEEGSLEE